MNNIKNNSNNQKMNNTMKKSDVIALIVTSAWITTIGSVFAIKVNRHIEKYNEDCKENDKSHIFCWAYKSETGRNTILIILTFLTTILLGLIIYYFFDIII